MAKTTAPETSVHSVSVDHDLLMKAKQAGGHQTLVDTVHAGLRLLAAERPVTLESVALAAGKPAAEMTEPERANTKKALRAKRRGLNNVIPLLEARAQLDPARRGKIDVLVADLKKKVFDLDQKLNALKAGDLTMAPPTSETVGRISALADSVGEMTADAEKTDTIIDAAVELAFGLAA